MLGPNRVIDKDGKVVPTAACQMRDINSRGNALDPNSRKSLPCTVRTSRQRSFNQRVGSLLLVWLGSMIFVQLVPCCGQDGSRALVPHHPIDSFIQYISHILVYYENKYAFYMIVKSFQRLAVYFKSIWIIYYIWNIYITKNKNDVIWLNVIIKAVFFSSETAL